MFTVLLLRGVAGTDKYLHEFPTLRLAELFFALFQGKNGTHWLQLMGPEGTIRVWRAGRKKRDAV
jgi:hypothetical protein